jgi:transposase-like protein
MFPITDLLDDEQSEQWLLEHFHPEGLACPKCGSIKRRIFRQTQTSRLTVYRCLQCEGIYNLYSGTLFEKKHLRPSQVVLLLRGVAKGESSLSEELGMSRTTVHYLRKQLQENAQRLQPETPLTDDDTETDEMFQNAGGKGERHPDPDDPPRRRANKRQGHGSYDNDRPPIVGSVGRTSAEVRLRVEKHTDQQTLLAHVHRYAEAQATVYTDEWRAYERVQRTHLTVCHGIKEWARDEDMGMASGRSTSIPSRDCGRLCATF